MSDLHSLPTRGDSDHEILTKLSNILRDGNALDESGNVIKGSDSDQARKAKLARTFLDTIRGKKSGFSVKKYGAKGDGVHDDTKAIQDAIDAAVAAGGGTILFPDGDYLVAGPMKETSNGNSQLLLPTIDKNDTDQIPVHITFEAENLPYLNFAIYPPMGEPTGGVRIRSNSTTSGGNLLGCSRVPAPAYAFSKVGFESYGIIWQIPDNPVISALNLEWVTYAIIDRTIVNTNTWVISGVTEPTTTTSYGIKLPNHNGVGGRIGILTIGGIYNGIRLAEHMEIGSISLMAMKIGMEARGCIYGSVINRLLIHECERGIKWTGKLDASHPSDLCPLVVGNMTVENTSGGDWYDTLYNIDDPNHYGRGIINYVNSNAPSGSQSLLSVNGAQTGLELNPIRHHGETYQARNSNAVSIPNNTVTKLSFPSVDNNPLSLFSNTNDEFFTTIPGLYEFEVSYRWEANATGYRQIQIQMQDSQGTRTYGATIENATGSSKPTQGTYRCVIPLNNDGDKVRIEALQNSGGALDLEVSSSAANHLRIRRVGSYQSG